MRRKSNYFKIYELVSRQVYQKYGQTAWQFFDPRLLETLDFLREKLAARIIINDWFWDGNLQQRGLRCNLDPIVAAKTNARQLYCSAHCYGQAADFDVEGMTAQEVRDWLLHTEDLPHPIRLEDGVNWVHIDVRNTGKTVYLFNP